MSNNVLKVMLISPRLAGNSQRHMHAPLGLLYLKSAIISLAEVQVIDCNVETDLIDKLNSFHPDLIGISVLTPTFSQSIEIARQAKLQLPDVLLCAGGMHASSFPDELLRREFDFIIRGEGENSFRELITTIANDQNRFQDIAGLSYITNEGLIFHNKDRKLISNLDCLSPPYRDRDEMSLYGYASVITSRGCSHRCYYCSSSFFWGKGVRYHPVENIINEITNLIHLGVTKIYFCDDNFTQDSIRLNSICNSIISNKLDFNWTAFTRLDTINAESLRLMKQAGCNSLSMGIECGSNNTQIKERNITIDEIITKHDLVKSAGIATRTSWMIGMCQSFDEEKESLTLMKILRPDQISIHMLIPFPNTDAWLNPQKYNIISNNPESFNSFNTTYSPALLDDIKYKHICKEQIQYLVNYFKSGMIDVGYTDIKDKPNEKTQVIESFLDNEIIPMIW